MATNNDFGDFSDGRKKGIAVDAGDRSNFDNPESTAKTDTPVGRGSDGFSSVNIDADGWDSKSFDTSLLKKRG